MVRACARCGTVFPGQWGLYLMWCKVDRFYVCRRCWEWDCHEGHGEGRKNVGWSIHFGFVFLGFVFLFAGLVGLAAVLDGVRIQSYASLPLTAIADLPAAGTVKVQGLIIDAEPVAWGGREVSTDNGWTWKWNTTDSFRVRDDTGEVAVVTSRWWVVEETSHPAPYAIHTAGSVYLPGDAILLVAEVREGATGRHLEAVYASPDLFRMDAWLPTLLGALAIAPFLIALDIMLRTRHQRAVVHRKRSLAAPAEPAGGEASPDASLPWTPNLKLGPNARIALLSVAGIATAWVLIVFFLAWAPHDRSEIYAIIVLSGVAVGFGVGVPTFGYLENPVRPTAMALTDRGVNFWYASRYERHLQDGFIAWDEVKFIGVRGGGDSAQRTLERKNGVTDNLGFLTADNWKRLLDTWRARTRATAAS